MTPFQGAGASQAIEDAFLLASLLASSRTTRSTAPRALQLYSQVRQPAAARVATLSRNNGLLFSLHGGPGNLADIARRIQRNFDEAQEGDPLVEVRRVVDMFESS
ncbi:hypothetical protein K488DRAFT_73896 [Vararia minispora EC-137]|uniref:Uncharacterized protein n=1 Tax=Vararia minispora EC-137 TaxID=1314806 RepID=A0ACB8QAJ6_9AGAM|nr:hypothetical protein K488DRAFT_73896 [Vararia minispora EC-137]